MLAFFRVGLEAVPSNLPASSVDLYLSFNEIVYLPNSSFSSLVFLKRIVLSNNKIRR